MNNEHTSRFIDRFLKQLENNGTEYCVLRGYSNLPEKAGRDIDIFIENSCNVKDKIKEMITSLGWECVLVHNEHDFFTYICTLCSDTTVSVLQLDFWVELNWRKITWCSSEEVLKDLRKVNDYYVVSEGAEAVITSIKELMGGGTVKEKYYNEIERMATQNKEKFVACLTEVYGDYAEKLWELCKNGEFNLLDKQEKVLKKKLIKRKPFIYLCSSTKKVVSKLRDIICPRGKLIAFVGPDGSGKTTIMNKMEEYLLPFFAATKDFHMRYNIFPELKTGYGFSSMGGKINANSNADEKKVSNKVAKRSLLSIMASWFVVLYYTLEFILGNFRLLSLKRKNILVLYDRYYYDHFIQPTTRDLIYPFRKILLAFVARPDIIIHLNAKPETVYARKQELSMREIGKQNEYMDKILQEMSFAYCVDTDNKSIDQVAFEAFKCIYAALYKA